MIDKNKYVMYKGDEKFPYQNKQKSDDLMMKNLYEFCNLFEIVVLLIDSTDEHTDVLDKATMTNVH